jgi:mycothione reductase
MRHFDLCIIGSGSGNSIPDERFADLDIAIVEKGTYGGTCLNVGCIPTKMFVYPADLASSPEAAARLGVDLTLSRARWEEIRDRVFGRIDPISAAGEAWRRKSKNITLFRAAAHFVGSKTLDTGTGEVITADQFVLAAGSRAVLPEIDGLDSVTVHTSDTVMRLPSLPASILIVGGGFIAAEFSHIFSAFGVRVTIVNRSEALLRHEDGDVSARFTQLMSKRVDVRLHTTVSHVERRDGDRVAVTIAGEGGPPETLEVDVLLIATGRMPNGDTLNLPETGVKVDEDGYVVVDEHQRTSADGIYALGDVSSPYQLKHVANEEMRVVQHNLLHPDDLQVSKQRYVPHAVFSEPQIASVGLTEEEAKERGINYVTAVQDYGSVAYGWAMEDTEHFAKLLADPASGQLIGAHLIGPQASSLIQPLIQAMTFGLPAQEMARGQYWIHPAISELVENALLALTLE